MAMARTRAKPEKTRTPGIYRRGSSYTFSYRYRGRQQWATAPTLVEARRLRERIRSDLARGEFREHHDVAFGEFADEWIDHYQGRTDRGFREATRRDYRRALKRAKRYFDVEARLRLAEIEPRDVRAYITWLTTLRSRGKPLSRATIQRQLAPLKALFADAVEDGVLRSNPAAVRVALGTEKVEKPARRALTREELSALLSAAPEDWQLFLRFMVHTGLRISEAIELRWRDVDFGKPTTLSVRRTFRLGEVHPPKSKYGVREIPLAPGLAAALFEVQREPEDLVFTNGVGNRLDPNNLLNYVLRPAALEADLDWKPTMHSLRHTCASLLFDQGRNAVQVQRWLGHHSPDFTLKTYVHLLDEGIESADFLDEVTDSRANARANISDRNSPKSQADRTDPKPHHQAA